ncbi:MAG TPA: beta-ketoacyl synthase N-terminal-like domain-containing protein [Amycolatopsis sp.]|uniref:beta-ketoacyl synthase N-terminal-like domain-containing protein n=1 Tax=Amycolatopsis sp. TaxID=37632 RepID=UPI002B485A7D|nr:beta-ketoacyl synthase N-terminal-like domain-containing protein [Amycolatopsis sp.]HKS46148.1 beta-ketoacyl synthase N-terminal-like domain-containing protein [Amycolatopsis sp.]
MIVATADASAPPVPGFVESTFNPLVYQVAQRCLSACPGDGARTAVVLASMMGDATTLDLGSRRLAAGQAHNPLLFMQSTANAVLGHISREFGITGPLLSLSTLDDLAGELFATARVLLEDGELDRVLLIGVELAGTARTTAAHRELGTEPPSADRAVAIVIDRDDEIFQPPEVAPTTGYGSLRGLIDLAARTRGTQP